MTLRRVLVAAASAVVAVTAVAGMVQDMATRRSATLSNYKYAALGILMYCNDWDDISPNVRNNESAYYASFPYVRNKSIFATLNPNGGAMEYNRAVGGANLSKVPKPATVPLYYDSKAWPDGSRCVAFLDGHVVVVDGKTWAIVSRKTRAKYKKFANPLPAWYNKSWKDAH